MTSQEKVSRAIEIIRGAFGTEGFIPLHEPRFIGNEKKYLGECIDSTFVSYLGKFVGDLEKKISEYTGVPYCISVSSGTSALHLALLGVGVDDGTLVVTQPLTFVATCNAVKYCGADPLFVDVDLDNLGMSPESLMRFLSSNTRLVDGACIHNKSGKRISACVPVHVFGHSARIVEIRKICEEYGIPLVEDSAESLGTFFEGKHTGSFGDVGVLSFNGNKIVTCGGGGAVLTRDEKKFTKIKHLSTTAKVAHAWEYRHDEIGYNYRMPNLNAAVALAQFENIELFLAKKRELSERFARQFEECGIHFFREPKNSRSNYWLNALVLENRQERDLFLEALNTAGVMSRPAWELMSTLAPFKHCEIFESENAQYLVDRLINIPSSVGPS